MADRVLEPQCRNDLQPRPARPGCSDREPNDVRRYDGRIVPAAGTSAPRTRYVVAPDTVKFNGPKLAQQGRLALYRVEPPMRLATLLGGIYLDSWMADFAALTHYATPRRPGRFVCAFRARAGPGRAGLAR